MRWTDRVERYVGESRVTWKDEVLVSQDWSAWRLFSHSHPTRDVGDCLVTATPQGMWHYSNRLIDMITTVFRFYEVQFECTNQCFFVLFLYTN